MTPREEFSRQFKRFLDRYDRFVLSGHVRPDGDAVGACAALIYALQNMGKEAVLMTDGDPSRYTSVLEPFSLVPETVPVEEAGSCFTTGSSFAFIMLDCSEPDRTGRAAGGILAASASMSIDHHVTSTETADFNYCEPETSSASQILYGLLKLTGITITPAMANALFMGVAYDTGGFRHNNAAPESFAMAAELRALGADSSFMMNYLFHSVSLKESKVFAAAVEKSHLTKEGILICAMDGGDFARLGAGPKSADGVVGRLTEIQEAKVVCYLREIEDGIIRVNMRSKCEVNVARIAALYGGGGHVLAAGCTIKEPMLLAKQAITEAVRRQMQQLQDDQITEEED
ncbi:MAG: bifunctional oligoribonuclease/PAP phosphatase NrnA [Lachnospiraceae bacterium]|nr:bifunctional oligoribonuclease/PAP phosphatase NrnA [Lachnospiraceae bacterium]